MTRGQMGWWLGAVGVLLLYGATRLWALTALPVFLDEAYHIEIARLVWDLQPFHAASDGRLLNVWWMALFWPFQAGVWVSRAAHVLGAMVGLAALLALVREGLDWRMALVAGVLYIFTPLVFFYERMALADSLSAAAVTVGVLFGWRAARRETGWGWAALSGLALAAAVLVKLSNVVFVGVPLAVAVSQMGARRWQRLGVVTLISLSVWVGVLTSAAGVLNGIGGSDMGLDLLFGKTATDGLGLPGYLPVSGPLVWARVVGMMSWPVLAVLGILVVVGWLNVNGRLTWLATMIVLPTVGVLVVRTAPGFIETRFLPVYVPLIMVGVAGGLQWLVAKLPNRTAVGLTVFVLAMVGLPGGLFMGQAYADPAELPLMDRDQWQYVRGWPSGYGFAAVRQAAEVVGGPMTVATLDLGGWQRLTADAPATGLVTYRWMPVAVVLSEWRTTRVDEVRWLVVDWPKDELELAQIPFARTEVLRVERPGGESVLIVYQFGGGGVTIGGRGGVSGR